MDLDKLLQSAEPRSIYYALVAGGVRAKLLESMVETKLLDLYKHKAIYAESHIINTLSLQPLRAKKWLNLLSNEHFLAKTEIDNENHYALGKVGKAIFNEDPDTQAMCDRIVSAWKWAAAHDLNASLHGAQSDLEYSWPPKTAQHAYKFELWMSQTAYQPIYALEHMLNLHDIKNMLDVGGGDGTVACALARHNPQMQITVYNLPHPASLARNKIALYERENQINVYEGDFIKEESFPTGFDYILFCRILWDWSIETDRKLLKMAYDALPPGGHIAICEAFRDTYPDFALGEGYRYLFWKDLEVAVFKTTDEYIALLTEMGFTNITLHIDDKVSTYSVIVAQRPAS